VLPDIRFEQEDVIAGEHLAALDERRHPRGDRFISIVSPAY
jgi:hypothetical protein